MARSRAKKASSLVLVCFSASRCQGGRKLGSGIQLMLLLLQTDSQTISIYYRSETEVNKTTRKISGIILSSWGKKRPSNQSRQTLAIHGPSPILPPLAPQLDPVLTLSAHWVLSASRPACIHACRVFTAFVEVQ